MVKNTGTIIAYKQSSKGIQVKIALDLRICKSKDEFYNVYLNDDEKYYEFSENDYLELDEGINHIERHTSYVFTIVKVEKNENIEKPEYKITCLETN